MTEKSSVKEAAASKSERLSKDDLQYLMGLLDKAEEEIEVESEPSSTTSPAASHPNIRGMFFSICTVMGINPLLTLVSTGFTEIAFIATSHLWPLMEPKLNGIPY
jgi:hypothetical protein